MLYGCILLRYAYYMVSYLGSLVAVMDPWPKWLPGYQSIPERNQAGTRRQGLKQKPPRNAAYWLRPHGLLSLLWNLLSDLLLGMELLRGRWGPLTPLVNQDKVPPTCRLADLKEVFPQLRVPLHRWLCLCQVSRPQPGRCCMDIFCTDVSILSYLYMNMLYEHA